MKIEQTKKQKLWIEFKDKLPYANDEQKGYIENIKEKYNIKKITFENTTEKMLEGFIRILDGIYLWQNERLLQQMYLAIGNNQSLKFWLYNNFAGVEFTKTEDTKKLLEKIMRIRRNFRDKFQEKQVTEFENETKKKE